MLIEVIRPGFDTVYEPGLPAEYLDQVPVEDQSRLVECRLWVCQVCGAVDHAVKPGFSWEVCRCRGLQSSIHWRNRHDVMGTLEARDIHYHLRPA